METPGNAVFWISLVGLLILSVLSFRKNRNLTRLIMSLAVLVMCGGAYYLIFQTDVRIHSKGAQPQELSFIIILYVCMLLGILCHYFYDLFESEGKPPAF